MNRKVYAYVLGTYGRHIGYWIGFIATIGQTLINRVVLSIVLAHLASTVVRGDTGAARQIVILYFALGVGGLLLRYARDIIGNLTENKVYAESMVRYYNKLVAKDLAFYRDNQTGYLAGTFRQHVDGAINLVRLWRGDIVQSIISLVVPMMVLIFMSWKVGLVLLGVVIVQVAYVWWSSKMTANYRQTSHQVYRNISGLVSDDVTNIVAFKASGEADQSRERMQKLAAREQEAFATRRKLLAKLDGPRDAITFLGAATVLWLVATSGLGQDGSVALLILTITYMMQIYTAVQGLPKVVEEHDDLVSQLYPTLDYLTDSYESVRDTKKPKKLARRGGSVDIQDVSFAYKTNSGQRVSVFSHLSIRIPAGQQVGIVGLSGAGKSTLAGLLMRFDDIDTGSIKVDGIDIRKVAQVELRQAIAFVPQEPLLFHRTIKENITYFHRNATQKQIERAAKAAHAHEFIIRLPDGYETLVGERGVKLSGGQKQRVVLARSILKDADIMIFDEATSALDSASEKIIQAALPKIIGKRTAIVIAHRLSTVADLDRIVVMQGGQVIEDGTHDELLALDGQYAQLWRKQIRAVD